MKLFTLLTLVCFIGLNSSAQTDEKLQAYGKELFTHFVAHDISWMANQLANKQQSNYFIKSITETFNSGQEVEIVWSEVIIDKVVFSSLKKEEVYNLQVDFMWSGISYSLNFYQIFYDNSNQQHRILIPRVLLGTKQRVLKNPNCPE